MWCETIISELIRRGVTYFVISPGSRSTPLTLAVARHPDAAHIIAYDERGAAYYALGYARATERPAALICTSGTAAANYLPAIAEASQDAVPLVAITADRPPEQHGIGANQTMDQQHLYGDFVRAFANVPPETPEMPPTVALEAVKVAVNRCMAPVPGPVHINCMIREPYDYTATPCATDEEGTDSAAEYEEIAAIDLDALVRVRDSVARAERGVLVVGYIARVEDRSAVDALASALDWPVWADIRSGLRSKPYAARSRAALERMFVASTETEMHQPDLILHLGGGVVSKRLLTYLGDTFRGRYIKVTGDARRRDPTQRADFILEEPVAAMCHALMSDCDSFSARGPGIDDRATDDLTNALQKESDPSAALVEPAIGYLLSHELTGNEALYLGNSMPVRFCDRFALGDGMPEQIAANRGVSGIDGTMASAIGFGAGFGGPVVCLLGDLSFLHDMNALSLLSHMQQPLIVLVVNNNGGGIFHHLPIAKQVDLFEPFFVTPHSYTFEGTARQFGLAYSRVETNGAFVNRLRDALERRSHTVIELTVDQARNMAAWRRMERLWV